jgi:hypothetical protein
MRETHQPPAGPGVAHAPTDEEELIEFLERDQLVTDRSVPVSPARLGPTAVAALWALRVFVVIVSAMVIYTFIAQLN